MMLKIDVDSMKVSNQEQIIINPIPLEWVLNWSAAFPLFEAWFCSESEDVEGNRVNAIAVLNVNT